MPTEKATHSEPAASAATPQFGAPAWTDSELHDPHHNSEKARKVRGMFGAIAGKYDLNNRVHSLWRDQAWRKYAVKVAAVKPGDSVLDVACGTGDLTELFAQSPAGNVTGVDFTPEMLDVARAKLARREGAVAAKVRYVEGDAQALAFPAASADVLSIAFGIRNVADPALAIAEFARVLKPGGRVIILEFGTPTFPPARWLNDWYCGWLMPRTATLISGDKSGAYKYLPKSVGTFMDRSAMTKLLEKVGFEQVTSRSLTLGICICYRGIRKS